MNFEPPVPRCCNGGIRFWESRADPGIFCNPVLRLINRLQQVLNSQTLLMFDVMFNQFPNLLLRG